MNSVKSFFAALFSAACLLTSAADLTFDVKINRGAEVDCNPEIKKQTVAYFVIDCSGSMAEKYVDQETNKEYCGPSGRDAVWSRDRLIRDKMLPERFEGLPAGAKVVIYYYVYGGNLKGKYYIRTEKTLNTEQDKTSFLKEIQENVYKIVDRNGYGLTPYYDTMEKILIDIKESDLLNDPHVSLMLFDYTDGANYTGDGRGFSYPTNKRFSLETAKDRFENKWGYFLKQITKNGFYEQLNVGGKKENPGVKHIPAYKVAFNCDNSALKSPQDVTSQNISLYASFPVNQESWELLQKMDDCSMQVQIGNGSFQRYPVSLKKSVNSIKVTVPAEAMDKATRITVAFDCPKGVQGKFTLEPPAAPVKFYLPAPLATVENVTVSPQGTVLVNTVVHFTAEGCAKNYNWSFSDGQKMKGKTVSRKFDRVGDHKFNVAADGNQKSQKDGKIEVVAIDIMVCPQSGALCVPGQKTEFEAQVPSGNIKPSSCTWYVIGPIDPNSKENPDVTRLADNTSLFNNPLKNHYAFNLPGKYTVKVIAKYKDLPAECREAETTWIVSASSGIPFSKSMEGDGHLFEYGGAAKLAVDVIGNVGDIIWKADGVEIGKGEKIDAPAVKANCTIVYSVEATDKNTNKKLGPFTRTYSFGCNHQEPSAEAKRASDNGPSWGVNEKVLFTVVPADAYTDIQWNFGDDSAPVTVTNGQNCEHAFEKAGVYTCTLTCKCKKCGTAFEKTLKDLRTESKDPKPVLKLSSEKASYSKDEGLTVSDTGTGDYTYCRLMLKDEATGEFRQLGDVQSKNYADFSIEFGKDDFEMASYRADFTIKLQALNRDSNGEYVVAAETKERTLRIRNHWIDAGILAGVVAFFIVLISLMKRFLLGNEPCGWKVWYTFRKELVSDNPADKRKLRDNIFNDAYVSLQDYWTVWTLDNEKKAVIPAQSVFDSSVIKREGTKLTVYKDGEMNFSEEFSKVSNYTLPVEDSKIYKSMIFQPRAKNSKAAQYYIYLILDRSESDTHYLKWFYALCFIFLVLALALALWLFFF